LVDYGDTEIVVLWCTHYLYIKENIKKYLPNVEFIDGNAWIARQIKNVLTQNELLNAWKEKGSLAFYDTKDLV
jgi:glutamate racemase